MIGAEPDIGIGGEMEHDVAACDRRFQRLRVKQVGLDEAEGLRLQCTFEKSALASRKIVIASDVVTDREKPVDEIAADEAGGAGNETFHE